MLAYLVWMFWYHRGHLRFLKGIFRISNFYKRFTLKWLYILTFFIYILILWPAPLCNFMSLSLRRWIFSRQSPRPSSCSHPFRRHRDIYRKLSRKTDQKTLLLPFVELAIKFVIVIGWTLYPLPIILLLCKNIVQQYLIAAV